MRISFSDSVVDFDVADPVVRKSAVLLDIVNHTQGLEQPIQVPCTKRIWDLWSTAEPTEYQGDIQDAILCIKV